MYKWCQFPMNINLKPEYLSFYIKILRWTFSVLVVEWEKAHIKYKLQKILCLKCLKINSSWLITFRKKNTQNSFGFSTCVFVPCTQRIIFEFRFTNCTRWLDGTPLFNKLIIPKNQNLTVSNTKMTFSDSGFRRGFEWVLLKCFNWSIEYDWRYHKFSLTVMKSFNLKLREERGHLIFMWQRLQRERVFHPLPVIIPYEFPFTICNLISKPIFKPLDDVYWVFGYYVHRFRLRCNNNKMRKFEKSICIVV